MSDSQKEMKVLHVITCLNDGGAESVLSRLCQHSQKLKHVVVSLMDAGKYGPILTQSGITVYCLGMRPGKPSLYKFIKLFRLIKSERPDIVQTWMYHADLLGGIAARLAGVANVIWGIHHSVLEKGKSKRSTILIAHICAVLSKFVPKRIVCCAQKSAETHRDLGYDRNKIVVITNGFDLRRFNINAASRAEKRKEWGISPDKFVIGNVGRFDPLKDHLNLFSALSIVRGRGVDFCCILVGKGLSTDNNQILGQLKKLKIDENIFLIGQQNDIPSVMNGFDLHVLASRSEAFPSVIPESMACGTPCISTDVGDAMYMIGNEDDCCPPCNPDELALLIIKMEMEWRENPEAWEKRSYKGRVRVEELFSLDAMVSAYEALWLGVR